jgi:coproporphyrinogen III oxidase-like Fe-S oxidoreductase
VSADDLPLEYFMNRFRLFEPAPKAEFEAFTGLPLERVETMLAIARTKELIEDLGDSWQLTSLGHRYSTCCSNSLWTSEHGFTLCVKTASQHQRIEHNQAPLAP